MNAIEKPSSSGAATDASPSGIVDPASMAPAELAALALQFRQALSGTTGPQTDAAPKALGLPGARQMVDGDAASQDMGTLLGESLFARNGARLAGAFPSSMPAGTVKADAPSDTDTHGAPTPGSLVNVAASGNTLGDDKKQGDTNADPAPDTLGAAVLQSLLNQGSNVVPVTNTAASTTTTASAPVQSLESVVAETVSRVLVSDPLHDGRREVRIEVAKEVLPDTQIRLWRQEGRLHVEFTSTQSVAENGLRDALPRLGEAIQQRQPETETPVVTLRTNAMDAGGQPGDGRSRQQYYVPGEEELA